MNEILIKEVDTSKQEVTNIVKQLFKQWNKELTFSYKPNIFSFLAQYNDVYVGMGFLAIYDRTPSYDSPTGKVGEMCSIFTLEEYRNKGIATNIIKAIINKGKQLNLDYIHSDAINNAIPLYIKCGFIKQDSNESRIWIPLQKKEEPK